MPQDHPAPKRKSLVKRLLIFGSLILLVGFGLAAQKRETRLSAAVAIVSQGTEIEAFLAKPGISVMEAWAQFPPELGDDTFFGIDQEFVDGVDHPYHLKGGDWMAVIALLRGGSVWVAKGTQEALSGKPSSDRTWEILQLDQDLKPGVWYRLRSEVDFGRRRYVSFSIEGPGLEKTFDLSRFSVDYPNYIPMNQRAMSYYVFTMRARKMMKGGEAKVYFDDAVGGVRDSAGSLHAVFSSGFENTPPITDQPLTLPVIDLSKYKQKQWYKERPEALLSTMKAPFARTGSSVGVCDADLDRP